MDQAKSNKCFPYVLCDIFSVIFYIQFSPTSVYLQSSFSRAIVGLHLHFPTLHVGDGYRILCGAGDMSYALASTLQDG